MTHINFSLSGRTVCPCARSVCSPERLSIWARKERGKRNSVEFVWSLARFVLFVLPCLFALLVGC